MCEVDEWAEMAADVAFFGLTADFNELLEQEGET